MDEFVDIKDYEGLYKINKQGEVLSLARQRGSNPYGKDKRVKAYQKKNGYWCVDLFKNNKRKHFHVHRLVAQTFIPNPDNLPQVNHKDENRSNNNVDNLEWCDNSYNVCYSKIPQKLQELRGQKLKVTNIRTKETTYYKSINDCYSKSHISWESIKKYAGTSNLFKKTFIIEYV